MSQDFLLCVILSMLLIQPTMVVLIGKRKDRVGTELGQAWEWVFGDSLATKPVRVGASTISGVLTSPGEKASVEDR